MMDLTELNELTEFLRQRAGEDFASGDDLRRARGRAISMLVGQAGNVPEICQTELRWLASNYAGHPDYRAGWLPDQGLAAGASMASEVRVFARGADGTETDITEGVQALYDLVIGSTEWGSGFWTAEDARPVALLARACGFGRAEEAERYLREQERYLREQ